MTSAALRLGLIGAGRWSRAYLKTAAALSNEVEIVAVARRQDKRLDPPFEGLPVFTEWRAMLDLPLDGLIIATPPSQHTEAALAAIGLGLPVMIEKPLTLRIDDALALRHAARANATPIVVDHTQTFHPAFRHILEHTRHQRLEIRSLSGAWGTFRDDCSSLWDWGAHDVAMALQLADADVAHLSAECLERRETPEGKGERFRIQLEFANGCSACLEFGNILSTKTRRLLVRADTESWLYDDWTPAGLYRASAAYQIGQSPSPASCSAIDTVHEMPLTVALREFCRRIRGADTSMDSIDLGVGVVQVLAEAETMLRCARND